MSISSSERDANAQVSLEQNNSGSSFARSPLFRFMRPLFFFAIIPALLCSLLYTSNIDGAVDLFHEGEWVTPAFEILQGKAPFRDVYLQHGWGVNALRSRLAFLLFGESLAASRKLVFGISGFLPPIAWVGVYVLLYSLFPKKIWIVPAFLVLALADVRIIDRHLLPFLSLALLARGAPGCRLAFLFAGALAGASIFYSLDTGIYALLIGCAFIAACGIGVRSCSSQGLARFGGRYLLGAAIGVLPFALYLLANGILDDFLRNSFEQIRYQREIWGVSPPSLASLWGPFESATMRNRTLYVFLKWYFPAAVYLFCALLTLPMILSRSLSEKDAPALLVLLAGIAFFPSALGRADEGHLMYALAPFWILGVCLLERAARFSFPGKQKSAEEPLHVMFRSPARARAVLVATILAFGLYFLLTCRNGGIAQQRIQLARLIRERTPNLRTLNIARAGKIRVPAGQAEEIESAVAFIVAQTTPDAPIFDFSNQGAYYFLAGRRNSTRFCQVAYAIPDVLQREAVDQLEQAPPAAVILREAPRYAPHERQPLIDEWIRERYVEAARIGENIILLPGENEEGRAAGFYR
jgi:hypothetical protein